MRRSLAAALGLGLAAGLPASAAAEERAFAEVVSEPVEVGSIFEVEVSIEGPGAAAAVPAPGPMLGDFRVLGVVPPDPDSPDSDSGDPAGTRRFRVRLGAFVLAGDHEIPGIPVEIRAPGADPARIETPPIPVRVVSSLPPAEEDAAADIHDIRGPFPLEIPPRWGRIALAALLLAALVAAVWLLWRRRRGREIPVLPPPPPAAEAEAALARLSAAGLLEAGEVVAYYERLAGIMKRYAGRRFETPWSERTTGEILHDLRRRAPERHAGALPLLADLLAEADIAKFSDRAFRPETARSRFLEAGVFLDRTRPPVVTGAETRSGGGRA